MFTQVFSAAIYGVDARVVRELTAGAKALTELA